MLHIMSFEFLNDAVEVHVVKEADSSSRVPPNRVAYMASAVTEPQILASAYGFYVDVMVFWFPMRYRHMEYRQAFQGIAAQLRTAVAECSGILSLDEFSMQNMGSCLEQHVAHSPAASLIVEAYSLGFSLSDGALIHVPIEAHGRFYWKIFTLPLFG